MTLSSYQWPLTWVAYSQPKTMKEKTKRTLRKWATKIKKDLHKLNETLSLDQLEKFIEKEDFDGIVDELRKMRKKRRKLSKKH
jgi:hypothetical protein